MAPRHVRNNKCQRPENAIADGVEMVFHHSESQKMTARYQSEKHALDFNINRGRGEAFAAGTTDAYKHYVMRKSFSKITGISDLVITINIPSWQIVYTEDEPS